MDRAPGELRIQTICLMVITAVAIAFSLYWLQSIVVPFVLALFLSLILTPLIDIQVRLLRLRHGLAVVTTLFLVFLVAVFLGGFVASSVAELTASAGDYGDRVRELYKQAIDWLPLEHFGVDGEAQEELSQNLSSLLPVGMTRDVILGLTNSIVGMFSQGLLVMMFMVFLLLGARTEEGPRPGVGGKVAYQVKRYLTAKMLISGATGVLVFLLLSILKVDFAASFGALAFFLNFIPNIGSIIATVLPLPVALLSEDPSIARVVLVIALPGTVQIAVGNIIEPKIMGRSLDLHPVVILIALMFWGMIWGIPGMFLAVPITAVMKITFEQLEITAPVAEWMAGRFGESGSKAVS